jgi:hypothetical protein
MEISKADPSRLAALGMTSALGFVMKEERTQVKEDCAYHRNNPS